MSADCTALRIIHDFPIPAQSWCGQKTKYDRTLLLSSWAAQGASFNEHNGDSLER